MRQYGLSKMEFSDVSAGDFRFVSDITKEFPHSGWRRANKANTANQKHKTSTLAHA